jgi:toxin ParE1/3/4
MDKLFVTRVAQADIDEVLAFISDVDFDASVTFHARLLGQFRMLADNPKAGRERDEISPGLRSFPLGNYLIFYRVWAGEVAIARVIHSARDLDEIFS